MNRKDVVVGVDIGGTNTVVGFVSKNGEIYHLGSLPTNGHEDAFVFFNTISYRFLYYFLRRGSSLKP